MARTGDTPRARALGAELQEIRNSAALSTRQLAKKLGKSNVTITRWETGHYPPSVEDTATLLGTLGVTGEHRDDILAMARDAADPNWLSPGVDKQLGALMDFERTAQRITEVSPLIVPGLLQTADYARAIMLAAGWERGEADQRVTLRMGRRDVLTRSNPAEHVAIIGEYALRYPPCDPAIMADQLKQLQQWNDLPHVTVQVLAARGEWSPALDGPFLLLEFPKTLPIVHLEHHRSSLSLYDRKDVAEYQRAADTIRRVAMSPAESMELIAEIADGTE